MASSGTADDSSVFGQAFTIDPEVWLFAKVTEVPADSWAGYSWREQIPQTGGTWADPPDHEWMIGDNGSSSGVPSMPAFPMDAAQTWTVGTLIFIVRGFQNGGDEQDSPGQEWIGITASAGSDMAMIRIVDVFVTDTGGDNWNYYPGVIQQPFQAGTDPPWVDEDTDDTTTTTEGGDPKPINCWVVNWFDYPNAIDGSGTSGRLCKNEGVMYDPAGWLGHPLPVYSTSQYAAMRTVLCTGSPPVITAGLGG